MVPQESPINTAIAEPKRPTGPIQPKDHIQVIDILRGFALLGILFVNIMHFGGVASLGQEWTEFAD